LASLSRTRRSQVTNYWPGFVDALSSLLLVIIFLLSLFMLTQFYLGTQLQGKDTAMSRLNQQIAELQAASAANAEQIRALAAQLKDVVGALEQAGSDAVAERAVTRRIAYAALLLAATGLGTGIFALVH